MTYKEDKQDEIKYAPILIPTLNRITHLKRCVESLGANSLAKKTDIFISVDYPSSDKWKVGYDEVCAYVHTISGFKNVYVFLQKENLGPYGNIDFLINEIRGKYDCFILTEDDNEFSPNVIEYWNKCLSAYENREDIIAVSAHVPNSIMDIKKETCWIGGAFSPYGCAFWVKKYDKVRRYIEDNLCKDILQSFVIQKKLYRQNKKAFQYFAGYLLGEIPAMINRDGKMAFIDITGAMAFAILNLHTVYPILNKTRNWGNDGSGVHGDSSYIEIWKNIPMDDSKSFEVVELPLEEYWKRVGIINSRISLKKSVRSWGVIWAKRSMTDCQFKKIKHLLHKYSKLKEEISNRKK